MLQKGLKQQGTRMDNIPAELIKQGGRYIKRQLMNIVTLERQEEKIPHHWKNVPDLQKRKSDGM